MQKNCSDRKQRQNSVRIISHLQSRVQRLMYPAFKCGGKGCRFCKGSGWIEILGCGMVHPHVLEMCGIDPKEYTGFAFGVGLERIALLKYEIDDMRLLYENDYQILKTVLRRIKRMNTSLSWIKSVCPGSGRHSSGIYRCDDTVRNKS